MDAITTATHRRITLVDLAGATLTMEVMKVVLREMWDEGHKPHHTLETSSTMHFYDAGGHLVGLIQNAIVPVKRV
jgi:hypothetical protein